MTIGWESALGRRVRDERQVLEDLAATAAPAVAVSPERLHRISELLADLVEAPRGATH